jgi:hypothetical protein
MKPDLCKKLYEVRFFNFVLLNGLTSHYEADVRNDCRNMRKCQRRSWSKKSKCSCSLISFLRLTWCIRLLYQA